MNIPINHNKPTILINFILDESGSMKNQRSNVISGFNEYLQSKKNSDEANYYITLVKFSDNTEVVYVNQPIDKCREITKSDYNPDGWTALNDAIARTIRATESRIREMSTTPKVLTYIFTDGQENASKEFARYGGKSIGQMVQAKEDSGDWVFTLIGASKEALKQAESLGIPVGNTFQYEWSNSGNTIAAMSGVTSFYANNVARSMSNGTTYTTSCLFKEAGVTTNDDINKLANDLKATVTNTTTTSDNKTQDTK